jgi:hypothetical protein
MNSIQAINIGNIEITFQYKEQCVTVKAEHFKTLGEVKESAIKKMICVPNDITCYYLNLDLSKEEHKKLGDLFKHKEKITIKLKKSLHVDNPYIIFKDDKQLNLNLNIKNINNIIHNNKEKLNYLSKKKTINKNLLHKNINLQGSYSLRLPKTDNMHLSRNKSDGSLGVLPSVSKTNRININLCGCKKNYVSDYCRRCRQFICNECKSKNHKNHLTIRLNLENLENNINLYGNLIQTDIKNMIELNKNILQNKNEIIDINLLEKHKENMNTKYQEIIVNYTNIMKKIKKYLDKENEGRVKLLVSAYNSSSVKIHKELYDLIEKLKNKYNEKSQKEIRFNDLEYYLNEINNKEGTLAFFKKDIIKYHLTNEINDKLKNSFDKINNILDEIINDDNPFNLDKKYYQELVNMKIVSPNSNNNDEDNK